MEPGSRGQRQHSAPAFSETPMEQQTKACRPSDHGELVVKRGEPLNRDADAIRTPGGYYVERTTDGYGVFRAHYDDDFFFDPLLIRGGFRSESEAEAEAVRLTRENGLVLALLLNLPPKLTNHAKEIYYSQRAQKICEVMERLENEGEMRRRVAALESRVTKLLHQLARKP